MKRICILLAFCLMAGSLLEAQGTAADYQRAFNLKQKYGRDKVYNANVRPQWIRGTHLFWYVRNTPEGNRYVVVDADKGVRKPLFDAPKLASALAKQLGREVKANQLEPEMLRPNKTLDTLRFMYERQRWIYAVHKDRLTKDTPLPPRPPQPHWMVVDEEKTAPPVTSPDGKQEAYIKDCNVWVRDLTTRQEKQLSMDGTPGNYYSAYIQWSPDSKNVATCKIRPVPKRYVYYVESSPTDQLQPKLHQQEYAKPGDELRFKWPSVFVVESGEARIPSTDLFDKQYEITNLRWDKDSRAVTFEYNQRGHQVYRILELSVATAAVRPLIEETSKTFVNYSRQFRQHLEDGRHIIWMSERDNWNHLYLYDRTSGRVERQITKGEWYVRDVLKVDEKTGVIYFSANGMVKDEDPYLIRYYRINMDGTNLVCLTPEEGMHQAVFSDDMQYLVDTYSLVTQAPVTVLRRSTDGQIVMPVEKADISKLLAEGWKAPEVFVAKGRDGQTDIWGIIVRPSNFDPNKKYPIIEYIYSGPGSQYVPKTFIPFNNNMSAIAELGFIVVQMDGMGTSFRSKAFEEICYKNLKDAGFPDRELWIKAAATRYSYMDIDRVGIFGASAGGQEAMTAVLLHGDFYKAAYSACGCHDNRMDKIWWNEQWMGYPIDESYLASSNVVNAHLLKRPLMLVLGELDDNVDPSSTFQVVNALVKANKDFEFVFLPGVSHTMGGDYGEHKRFDFFVRHLLGVEPPAWE